MKRRHRILQGISDKTEKGFLILLMFTMTSIVFLGVVTRYVFGFSFYWVEEVPRYCLVWVTFLGAATLMKGGINHPRVTKFVDSLPSGARKSVLILGNMLMILMTAIMGLGAIVMIKVVFDQVSPALELPMSIIYAVIPLSASIIIIRICFDIYTIFKSDTDINL